MRYFIIVLALAAAACGGAPPLTLSSPYAPSNPGPPTAVLSVSTFTATLVPPTSGSAYFYYDVKFRLSETSGKRGATLKTLGFTTPSGDGFYPCMSPSIRLNPGATWDMDSFAGFYDCGDYPYFAGPLVTSRTEISSLSVAGTFTDDDGRSGSFAGAAVVTR